MQKTAHCLGGSTLSHIMLSIASVTVCVRYASALLQAACMHAAEQYAMCFTSSVPAMENHAHDCQHFHSSQRCRHDNCQICCFAAKLKEHIVKLRWLIST